MLKFFRFVSVIEGISYLVILSVTLEVISRQYVFPLGITHGLLFIVYLISSLMLSHKLKWSVVIWLLVFLASIIPFAFIPVEFYLKKKATVNA